MTKRPEPHVLAAKVHRWITDPEGQTSISARIARRLAAGEELMSKDIAKQYGCSSSLVNLAAFDMRAAGYNVVTRHGNGSTRGTLKLIDGRPPVRTSKTVVKGNGMEHVRGGSTAHDRLEPARGNSNGNGKLIAAASVPAPAPLQHPMVGGMLQVRAVVMNDEGLEVMALDESGNAWQLAILGQTQTKGQ